MEREKRAQAVKAALHNFNHFIDILIQYGFYTRDELELYGRPVNDGEEEDTDVAPGASGSPGNTGISGVTAGGARDF